MTEFFADTDIAIHQHTLADSVTFTGRGLHTGLKVIMSILPADADTGIVFVRRDVNHSDNVIPALWNHVTDTELSTTVSNGMGIRVSTIEHLMAALHAAGIDNARVILDAPEVPIMDGSAAPFSRLFRKTGLSRQNVERKVYMVDQTVAVTEGKAEAAYEPSLVPWLDMTIEFPDRVIGRQKISMPFTSSGFEQDIAQARTFGFEEHLQSLKRRGFARGSSLKNAILIAGDRVVNCEGLRFSDEFVRHKYLDAVGDLALAGHHIIGHFKGHRSGHRMNNLLLRQMLNTDHVRLRPISEAQQAWKSFMQEQVRATAPLSA